MRPAIDYKTPYGLYRAAIRCIETQSFNKKAWWLQSALYNCKEIMKDEVLYHQIQRLIRDSAPRTIDDPVELP